MWVSAHPSDGLEGFLSNWMTASKVQCSEYSVAISSQLSTPTDHTPSRPLIKTHQCYTRHRSSVAFPRTLLRGDARCRKGRKTPTTEATPSGSASGARISADSVGRISPTRTSSTHTHTHAHTRTHTHTHTHTHTQTDTHKHTHRHTHTDTHTLHPHNTHTHTQRHTDTHTHTQLEATHFFQLQSG